MRGAKAKYGENMVHRPMRWRIDQLEKIEALAELAGKNRNEMIRDLIDMALEQLEKGE